MKRRGHISPFICLLIISFSLAAAGMAGAQEFMEPPYVPRPPGAMPSLAAGRFYFQSGVKYRSVESLRFNALAGQETIQASSSYAVPFGPTTAGNFGVGTGKAGFLGGGGNTWIYDNGRLNGDVIPDGAPALPATCSGAGGVIFTCNNAAYNDTTWTYAVAAPELGRFHIIISPPEAGDDACCNGLDAGQSRGSFTINDPVNQVNNLASMAGTSQVTFRLVLAPSVANPGANSLLFIVDTVPDVNRETGPKLWSPAVEMGYQIYDFFDIFTGFSWFAAKSSMGFTTILTGRGARTVIVDTFPFISDDVSAWPPGGGLGFSFNSSNRIVGADPAMNYHIAPNSPANGVTPNRQFSTQLDESIVPERIQQTVNNTVDINVYDMRWGGRSWLPLYGLGRLGVSLGFAFMPAYYKITENRNYLALGPNTPGEVLASVSSEHLDWRPHYGGFAGADLSLGVGPVYVNASADYTWATHQMYRLDFVETSFSPGGMSASAGVGVRF